MRKNIIVLGLVLAMWLRGGMDVWAVTGFGGRPSPIEASATATLTPTMAEKVKENITEPGEKNVSYRLEAVLEKQEVGKWNGLNSLRHLVRVAVNRGVAANTIVLLLLLPLVATIVSVLHYVFGVTGYGIFTPTMVAITFLATGIFGGLMLFAMILGISILANIVLKKLKLHFWPARSIGLVFMAMGTFALMIASSYFEVLNLTNISIFPVLLMILLAEDFVRTQLVKSKSEAKKLTIGTLILSMVGALGMSVRMVQESVLLHPEIVILAVLVINLWVGSYTGIRLSEIGRFKEAVRIKKTRSQVSDFGSRKINKTK